eukprot:gnl/TRDRNA2_/TRDRNA2_152780_c0_seq1.p1 gnl/TRDRNA2_/TRDRNA2_152780_c0~~gnl/TRDRNA2_/TRDRNA2_152780_c0_seq1.p1  ORF type:complete len:748 (+),score=117.49 gnl/TRDRNA2_/TRDRNA2_152780_c0_seq1:71-2245(+)
MQVANEGEAQSQLTQKWGDGWENHADCWPKLLSGHWSPWPARASSPGPHGRGLSLVRAQYCKPYAAGRCRKDARECEYIHASECEYIQERGLSYTGLQWLIAEVLQDDAVIHVDQFLDRFLQVHHFDLEPSKCGFGSLFDLLESMDEVVDTVQLKEAKMVTITRLSPSIVSAAPASASSLDAGDDVADEAWSSASIRQALRSDAPEFVPSFAPWALQPLPPQAPMTILPALPPGVFPGVFAGGPYPPMVPPLTSASSLRQGYAGTPAACPSPRDGPKSQPSHGRRASTEASELQASSHESSEQRRPKPNDWLVKDADKTLASRRRRSDQASCGKFDDHISSRTSTSSATARVFSAVTRAIRQREMAEAPDTAANAATATKEIPPPPPPPPAAPPPAPSTADVPSKPRRCSPGSSLEVPLRTHAAQLINPNVHSEFICRICLELCQEVALLPCSHVFCRECIRDYLDWHRSRSSVDCPACREPFTRAEAESPTPQPIVDWLAKAQVRCIFAPQAHFQEDDPLGDGHAARSLGLVCDWVGVVDDYLGHLRSSCCVALQLQRMRQQKHRQQRHFEAEKEVAAVAEAATPAIKAQDVRSDKADWKTGDFRVCANWQSNERWGSDCALSVNVGDLVHVEQIDSLGWARASKSDSSKGWLPFSICRRHVHVASSSYPGDEAAGYCRIDVGDCFHVYHRDHEGWMYGSRLPKQNGEGVLGWFPESLAPLGR